MSYPLFNYSLYLVTDEKACLGRDLVHVVKQAVEGGVDIVQYREKRLSDLEFRDQYLRLRDALGRFGVPLIINDRWELAKELQADGVHVGRNDSSPSMIHSCWPECSTLGYSIETTDQLNTPESTMATYLAVSPVFPTPTKINTTRPWGISGVKQLRALTEKPLVAIGGINLSNAAEVVEAGTDCLAVVSAICSAANPARAAEELRNVIDRSKRPV
jgi:thiamine-phosphate pyrophosphorylase